MPSMQLGFTLGQFALEGSPVGQAGDCQPRDVSRGALEGPTAEQSKLTSVGIPNSPWLGLV